MGNMNGTVYVNQQFDINQLNIYLEKLQDFIRNRNKIVFRNDSNEDSNKETNTNSKGELIERKDTSFYQLSTELGKQMEFNKKFHDINIVQTELNYYRTLDITVDDCFELMDFIINDNINNHIRELILVYRILFSKIDKDKTYRSQKMSKKEFMKYKSLYMYFNIQSVQIFELMISLKRIFQLMKDLE